MSPTYNTWVNMIGRCTRPYHHGFARYGAQGVTVCDRWLTFSNFLADMGERPVKTTLDRLDGARGYEPGNCRWATIQEQQGNTRSNVMATHDGRTQCVSAWARELGMNKDTLADRLKRGWGDTAFTVPVNLGNRIKPRQTKAALGLSPLDQAG